MSHGRRITFPVKSFRFCTKCQGKRPVADGKLIETKNLRQVWVCGRCLEKGMLK